MRTPTAIEMSYHEIELKMECAPAASKLLRSTDTHTHTYTHTHTHMYIAKKQNGMGTCCR